MTSILGKSQKPRRSDTLYVGSLAKGFSVLKAFRKGQRELGLADLGLSEIAKLSGLDKSAAQRFTNTLVELGYLEKDQRTRRYRPALKLTEFYYTYLVSSRLAELAMPRLIEASNVYGTTVNLCEPSGTFVTYTIRIPHQKAFYRATIPGRSMPAFCTAPGHAILATRTDDEIETILGASDLTPLTSETITDLRKIRSLIKQTRKDGYSITVEQSLPHEISTAAPVLNSERRAVAAVQIPVYMPHWTVEKVREKVVPLILETARAVSGSYFEES